MKAPPRLQSLIDEGLIDTVVRQLMSGKEAMVFVVRCGEETRAAKVYKDAAGNAMAAPHVFAFTTATPRGLSRAFTSPKNSTVVR